VFQRKIDDFGKKLMATVRDEAILNCDGVASFRAESLKSRRWKDAAISEKQVLALIPDIVDETLFAFLTAIDDGRLKLKYVADDGSEIDLGRDGGGELGGWLMASGGWRAQFSNERHYDDFQDLRQWPPDGYSKDS
jgi:hypothetical protein